MKIFENQYGWSTVENFTKKIKIVMNSTDLLVSGSTVFKKCTVCGFQWALLDDFLRDPNIVIIGYQVLFENLTEGLFLFNHSCKGTLAISAGVFSDLYDGPIFTERATGSEDCPSYCLNKDELRPCPVQCECAYVREIIQVIKNYQKSAFVS